ncbi:PKD domain-containing protein [candidate division WOR-3 bacterium]|nr:PKD domain-containing protein [candidate division WOR-3 bacterium]
MRKTSTGSLPAMMSVGHHLLPVLLAAALFLGSTCSLFNKPPSAPVISGPTAGIVGVPVEFTATATDPDGDSITYQFAWGDGDTSDWDGFVASGETTSVEHAYSDSGECTVRARAQDKNGGESGWSAEHVLRFISAGPAYPDSVCDSLYLGGAAVRVAASRRMGRWWPSGRVLLAIPCPSSAWPTVRCCRASGWTPRSRRWCSQTTTGTSTPAAGRATPCTAWTLPAGRWLTPCSASATHAGWCSRPTATGCWSARPSTSSRCGPTAWRFSTRPTCHPVSAA